MTYSVALIVDPVPGPPIPSPPSVCSAEGCRVEFIKAGSGTGHIYVDRAMTLYPAGTVLQITAEPDAGSKFIGWAGGCSGTRNICSVVINSNIQVVATFERIN